MKALIPVSFAIAAVGACLLSISCETESAGGGGSLSIHPREVTLGVGQSVTFKARGGETYAWSSESNTTNERKNIGRLSVTRGSTTTYTALSTCEEDVIIRVTSSLSTTTQSDTSSSYMSSSNSTPTVTSYDASAIATIHQQ